MDKKKIVLYNTEGLGTDVELNFLQAHGYADKVNLIRIDNDDSEVFFREAQDADGVIVMYQLMPAENLARLKKCQVLTIDAIGVNTIDLKAATELGICVGNVPDYCIEEVATQTVALFLCCARRLNELDQTVRDGQWDVYAAGQLHRMSDKVYGLVSFGNIARRTVELLRPFGMRLKAYDPYVADEVFAQYGVERVEKLDDLFAQVDYVSLHSPLMDSTRHMINAELLAKIKPGAVFINTGRGGLVDEDALLAAVEDGRIASAGLDVIENEAEVKSVLFNQPNITITPHTAFYSEESVVEEREKALLQILEVVVDGHAPRYLVNKEVLGKARFQQ